MLDYIPYAVHYTSVTYLFSNRKFVPLNPFICFAPPPTPPLAPASTQWCFPLECCFPALRMVRPAPRSGIGQCRHCGERLLFWGCLAHGMEPGLEREKEGRREGRAEGGRREKKERREGRRAGQAFRPGGRKRPFTLTPATISTSQFALLVTPSVQLL